MKLSFDSVAEMTAEFLPKTGSRLITAGHPISRISAYRSLTKESTYSFPVIDLPDVALSLSQLSGLIDRGRLADYWQQGLEVLINQLSAYCVSLNLLDQIPDLGKSTLRLGEVNHSLYEVVTAWEKAAHATWKDGMRHTALEVDELTTSSGRFQLLHIPVVAEQVVRGSITIVFRSPVFLNKSQFETVSMMVQSYAANGLRSAYLNTFRQKLDHANSLYMVLHWLTSSLDVRTVLEKAIETTAHVLNAEAATIFRYDAANNRLKFSVIRSSVAEVLEEQYISTTAGVVGHAFTHGEALVINDTSSCELFDSSLDEATGFNTRSILCVPLCVHGEKSGVLEVLNKKDGQQFSEDDVRWLSVIAEQIAVALKNAELYQQVRREQERLIKAQEDVRHQLARELHDNTAQMLNLIALRVEMSRRMLQQNQLGKVEIELEAVESVARQANREVRTLLYELRPIILESRGLIPALESYHSKLDATMNCKVHLDSKIFHVDMSLQDASGIFSIVQEAVNNVRKHAFAENTWIRVYFEADNFYFEVEDDGEGFSMTERMVRYDESGSYGLLNMNERASILGGKLELISPRPGNSKGTLVRGSIPCATLKEKMNATSSSWL